jgi:hypothetical protein
MLTLSNKLAFTIAVATLVTVTVAAVGAKVDFAGLDKTLDQTFQNCTWIWGGDNPRPINQFRLFRREFEISDPNAKYDIWIGAEFRYKLFINGEFVQCGPTPSQPDHRLLDHYSISRFLRSGRNCIGAIVHCPGIMGGQWTMCNAGLFCSIRNGSREILTSDENWRTIGGDAWHRPTELCPYGKGWQEWFDATKMPAGWDRPGFDDAGWDKASVLPFFAGGQAGRMCENYVGYPTLVRYAAKRIVDEGMADGNITPAIRAALHENYTWTWNRWERLMGHWTLAFDSPLSADAYPEPVAMLAQMENHHKADEGMFEKRSELPIAVQCFSGGNPYILLDLDIVRSGMLYFDITASSSGTVDIAWDDRLGPDSRIHPFRATPNCERCHVGAGTTKWQGFFERGGRYLQITFRGFSGRVVLEDVGIDETLLIPESAPVASFESSDELLNKVWRASLETTRLYMNGSAAGDPVRERTHWYHDDCMAARMAFYCYGNRQIWRRALELTSQSQNADGSFAVISPGNFEDWNMVCGSFYWGVEVKEYYDSTGDHAFARRMLGNLERSLNYELRFCDGEGLLYETPGRRFLSWADGTPREPYKPGETWAKTGRTTWGDFFDPPTRGFNAIINTYWLWCVRDSAEFAGELGRKDLQAAWNNLYRRGRESFEKRFWDEAVQLYRDNVSLDNAGNVCKPTFCESTLFMMLRAGLLEKPQGLACIDTIFEPDFVCCRSSGGLDLSPLPVFLIRAGRTGEALDLYRDRWGALVRAGATTCGEEFFHCGGNSDCHIHGAAPARDFIEYLAGIKIAGPLWSAVRFEPPVDGPELKCSVPTDSGQIKVQIESRGDKRMFSYSVPDGCKAQRISGGKVMTLPRQGSFEILK